MPAPISAHHPKLSGTRSLHGAFLHRATPARLGEVAVAYFIETKKGKQNEYVANKRIGQNLRKRTK